MKKTRWELADKNKDDVPHVFSKFASSSKNPNVQRMKKALA